MWKTITPISLVPQCIASRSGSAAPPSHLPGSEEGWIAQCWLWDSSTRFTQESNSQSRSGDAAVDEMDTGCVSLVVFFSSNTNWHQHLTPGRPLELHGKMFAPTRSRLLLKNPAFSRLMREEVKLIGDQRRCQRSLAATGNFFAVKYKTIDYTFQTFCISFFLFSDK